MSAPPAAPNAPPSVVNAATSNGILPPTSLDLPYPDTPELVTENILKLNTLVSDPRTRTLVGGLVKHLHQFITETQVTTAEWERTISFLTRVGQTCTPIRQEFILLSDVLGVSALIDAINYRGAEGATENSVFGPFYTTDAPDINIGDSIASEGKGEYMYVEGRVLDTSGAPIPEATIDTWEGDADGFYDTQYADRTTPDCRGRLHSDKDGNYGYRAIVPVPYPIPGDGPVGELLVSLGRHNMRPNHLHLMVQAPGYRKLVTALYPEGDIYLKSDSVFGVKTSLLVKLKEINDDEEARKRGFPRGGSFKLLQYDLVLIKEDEK